MKFLLLVVILDCDSFRFSAGSEASFELSVCFNGWVEFSCSYPNASITRYRSVEVFIPRGRQTLRIPESDRWDHTGNVLVYHNTTHRNLRVTVKELHNEDDGQFQCRFYPGPGSEHEIINVELVHDDPCQTISRTVNTAGEIKLTCQKRGKKLPVLFFCKEKDLICEEILSTSDSQSKGRFSLRATSHTCSLSISDVSSEDNGVYWFGGKPTDGRYRASIAKIQLEVKVRPQSASPSADPHGSLSSTTSTPWTGASPSSGSAAPEADGSNGTVVVAVLIFTTLLVLTLLLVVVYRKLIKTAVKAAISKEDHVYAEIQETTDSGTVMNSLYVSADFAMKPLVSEMEPTGHYSTVGEPVQLPTGPGDPLYWAVNLPQQ